MECQWQDKLIQVEENGIISVKKFTRAKEDDNRYELKQCFDKKHLPFGPSKCLACKCVLDYFSGWQLPYLLVTHKPQSALQSALKKKCTIHELLVCESSAFETCGLQFEVLENDLPCDDHFHLLDGPTVVWKKGMCVHIVHGPELEQMSLNLQTIFPDLKINEITRMWSFNDLEGRYLNSILLFVQISLKEAISLGEFGKCEWLCLKVQLQDKFTEVAVRVPDLVPFNYGYIATCIAALSSLCVDKKSGAMIERMVFLIGTEYQQVVVIESGAVRSVVPLQYVPYQLVAMKNCAGNVVFVAASLNGDVNAYEIEPTGPKERGMWTGVTACLSGDFARLGHSQILMLTDDKGVPNTGSFILTDLCKFQATDQEPLNEDEEEMMEEEEKEEEVTQDCPESLLNVMKALQLKKHIGEAQVTQFEMELHHKHELLSSSLKYMESLGKGGHQYIPLKPDPSLICLIPGELTSYGGLSGRKPKDSGSVLEVLETWQRIIDGGHWVVGVMVKNISEKVLKRVMTSLHVSGDLLTTESLCRVMWSNNQSQTTATTTTTSPPPGKKRRLNQLVASVMEDGRDRGERHGGSQPLMPGHAACLVVATVQQPPGKEATIICSWRENDQRGTMEVARMEVTSKLILSGELCVDKCCLDSWDGFLTLSSSKDYEFFKKNIQDLTCLLAVRSLTQVHISTQSLHITRLPSMIKERLPLSDHSLQVRGTHCSFWKPSIRSSAINDDVGNKNMVWKMLEDVALHVQLKEKDAVLSILHSSNSQLNLVLKLLKDSLPDDVEFSPLAEARATQHSALMSGLNSLREEASDKVMKLEDAVQEGDTITSPSFEPGLADQTDLNMIRP